MENQVTRDAWQQILRLQKDLSVSRKQSAIAETAGADRRAQLLAKTQRYTAELEVLREHGSISTALTADKAVVSAQHELREVLESSHEALAQVRVDLARAQAALNYETQLHSQHQQLAEAIEMKVAEARGGSMGDPPASADSSIADVRKSVRKVAKSNQILLKNMSEFIMEHFPELTEDHLRDHESNSFRGRNQVSHKFISFLQLLEDLMNRCLMNPEDPYIEIDPERHWIYYVEFLLRWGIGTKDPNDPSRFKLTEYHL